MTAPGDGPAEYDTALPGAQTELAPSAAETSAQTAWALDDGPEWKPPFWTSGRITAAAAGGAVLAVVVVAGLAGYHLRAPEPVSAPVTTAAPVVQLPTTTSAPAPSATLPPVVVTTVVVQQPPKTVTRQAAPPPQWEGGMAPIDSAGLPPAPTVLPALIPFDDEFVAMLRRNGFEIYDGALVLKQAHASCSMLQDGEHPDVVSRKLMGVNPDIDWQTAAQFIGTVRGVYPGCFPR